MDRTRTTTLFAGMQCIALGLLLAVASGVSAAPPHAPPPPPDAPPSADAAARIVYLIVDLAVDGTVVGVMLERSSGFPDLDRAALDAAATWHLAPLKVDGKPVAGKARVPVSFPPE